MTLAQNLLKNDPLPASPRSILKVEPNRQPQSESTSDLASIILELGEDPSLNIISILESGTQFLNCAHLNYVETSEQTETEPEFNKDETVQLPVTGNTRALRLYGLPSAPSLEKIQIFVALLSQQERRLREIIRRRDLKDYIKTLFEACPDGIVVCDQNGAIISTNRAIVSMTHRPAASLIGLKVSKLTTKEGRSIAFQALRKLKKQSSARFDCRMKIGPNRTIPVSIGFSDFHFQGQQLFLATVRDLSYLEEEAQLCSTYEQSLAHSITNATDGFVRYDQFGRITDVNPYIEKLTGVYEARLIGRPIDDLLTISSLRNFRKAVARLNENGYASFSCAVNNSDGSEILAHGTLTQFEVNGERRCRLMLQEQSNLAPLGSS